MKRIQILGTCSCCCGETAKQMKKLAEKLGVEVEIEWVKDLVQIAQYGIMKTPAVIVDDVLVHEGGTPSDEQMREWILE